MERLMASTTTADVPVVRHAVADHLRSLEVGADLVDTAALVVSELVTNAIKHAEPPIRCAAYLTRTSDQSVVRLEVWDASVEPLVMREPTADEESGRGLQLVEKLSSRWGWHHTTSGKCTWSELDLIGT
jgi:anti-sigma regulatory factor (Ser/Thr protein kinase)